MGSLLVFGCWLHFVSNIGFFCFLVFCFLFFWFIGFLVFPLNWDRLGSHKIDQKIAQNLNFGEDFARNHCKTQCFCIIFCMKNISQEEVRGSFCAEEPWAVLCMGKGGQEWCGIRMEIAWKEHVSWPHLSWQMWLEFEFTSVCQDWYISKSYQMNAIFEIGCLSKESCPAVGLNCLDPNKWASFLFACELNHSPTAE